MMAVGTACGALVLLKGFIIKYISYMKVMKKTWIILILPCHYGG